jgi:thiamine biosynthesis lipoprotein
VNEQDSSISQRIGRKNRRDTLIIIVIVLVLIPVVYLLVRWFDPGYMREPYQRSEWVLDDHVTITAYGKNRSQVEEAVDTAFQELYRIDAVANRYNPDSEVSRLNQEAGGEPVAVSEDLWELIATGMDLYEASGELFDITIGPLVDLWDIIGRLERGDPPPTDEEITAVMEWVGGDLLVLDESERTVYLPGEGMIIDLGGLAKGYALDRAAAVMNANGVDMGVINMISTSMTMGDKPESAGGPSWTIAILSPRGEGYMSTLSLPGGVYISTSGDYQRYFEYEGIRYHHIIDPRTGYPAQGVVSATVLGAEDGAWSDAASTAAFIMGAPEALGWVEEVGGIDVIIVDSDGAVHATSGVDQWAQNLEEEIDLEGE